MNLKVFQCWRWAGLDSALIVLLLYRPTITTEPDDGVHIDVEGVMIDFLEMDIDPKDPPSDDSTPPARGEVKLRQSFRTDAAPLEYNSAGAAGPQQDQEHRGSLASDMTVESMSDDVRRLELWEESPRDSQSDSLQLQLEVTNDTEHPNALFDGSTNTLSIDESLTLPVPFATLPLKQLLQQQWVADLRQILKQISPGLAPVSIVTADYKFREVLLNWLVAAKTQASPPLTHVIVFSLDQALCELLNQRRIHCVFVAPSKYLTSKAIASLTKHIVFSEVMVLRLTAMRLINYWGYDAANYDTDAIILKNPESLYLRRADSHLIGSYGHHPGELSRAWGTTVCCGLFMIRSSPHTEVFWNTMSSVLPKSMNDQARLNYALSALQPNWGNNEAKSIITDEWVATTPTGFKVIVLPARYVCRQGCSRKHRSEYYVWHKGGQNSDGKMRYAQRGRLWFLRKDWESRTSNSSATGQEWLEEITEPV